MKNVLLVLMALLLVSCSSRNDVVHSGFLQKRKYKKGYYLSLKKTDRKSGKENEVDDVWEEDVSKLAIKENRESNSSLTLLMEKKELDEAFVVSDLKSEEEGQVEASLNGGVFIAEKEFVINKNVPLATKVDEVNSNQGIVKPIVGILFTLGVILVVVGVILFGVGFLGILLGEGSFLAFMGSSMFTLGLVSLLVSAVLGVGKALEKPIDKRSRKVTASRKEKQEAYDKLSDGEKEVVQNKKEKRARMFSNVFTWATLLFPLFIIPAIVFNLSVIKYNKELKNKKRKNRAIWRLIALPFLAFIGLIVILSILESLGIITSVAA